MPQLASLVADQDVPLQLPGQVCLNTVSKGKSFFGYLIISVNRYSYEEKAKRILEAQVQTKKALANDKDIVVCSPHDVSSKPIFMIIVILVPHFLFHLNFRECHRYWRTNVEEKYVVHR